MPSKGTNCGQTAFWLAWTGTKRSQRLLFGKVLTTPGVSRAQMRVVLFVWVVGFVEMQMSMRVAVCFHHEAVAGCHCRIRTYAGVREQVPLWHPFAVTLG